MTHLDELLEISSRGHSHLCPRQILGVRMGLAGMAALGFTELPEKKRLLVFAETDGCFVDGLSAATNCAVGHRTLRIEDYGKIAAIFVDVRTGQSLRLSPTLELRQHACAYVPQEPRHYFAQMQAYRTMPVEDLFIFQTVSLIVPVEDILSRPGVRVNCEVCGEEIMNEREIRREGQVLCRACAGNAYYQTGSLCAITPCFTFETQPLR